MDSIIEILHDVPSRRENHIQIERGILSSCLYVFRGIDENIPSLSIKLLDYRIAIERRCSIDRVDDPTRKRLGIDRIYCMNRFWKKRRLFWRALNTFERVCWKIAWFFFVSCIAWYCRILLVWTKRHRYLITEPCNRESRKCMQSMMTFFYILIELSKNPFQP